MVNYKLGVFNKSGVKEINLKEVCNLKGLDKLDKFTCEFNDENGLKLYLINKQLVPREDLSKKIYITYRNCGKDKKLPVFYSDMEKYLDEIYLRQKLMQLSQDIKFLEKLARHYSLGSDKFNKQGVNVSDIRYYIAEVRFSGGRTFESSRLRYALDDLFIKALYNVINKETGEVKENYRGRRDLADFIYKYEKSLENQEEANLDNDLTNNNCYTEAEEQLSFFDGGYQKTLK